MLVTLNVPGMTTSVDTHLYDILGIRLGTTSVSTVFEVETAYLVPEICRTPWFGYIPPGPRDNDLLLQESVGWLRRCACEGE